MFLFFVAGREVRQAGAFYSKKEIKQRYLHTNISRGNYIKQDVVFFAFKLFTFELELLFLKGPHGFCELMTTMP